MTALQYDLLKMRHARAVASIHQFIAQANRETAQGGWLCDWSEAMSAAAAEAVECEKALENAIADEIGSAYSKGWSDRADRGSAAADACILIFKDYDESELARQPPSIRAAWEAGRDLQASNPAQPRAK